MPMSGMDLRPDVWHYSRMNRFHCARSVEGLCRAQAPAGKRKLLPAPKPLGAVGALPQDVLFGQGFKAPKLSRQ